MRLERLVVPTSPAASTVLVCKEEMCVLNSVPVSVPAGTSHTYMLLHNEDFRVLLMHSSCCLVRIDEVLLQSPKERSWGMQKTWLFYGFVDLTGDSLLKGISPGLLFHLEHKPTLPSKRPL